MVSVWNFIDLWSRLILMTSTILCGSYFLVCAVSVMCQKDKSPTELKLREFVLNPMSSEARWLKQRYIR